MKNKIWSNLYGMFECNWSIGDSIKNCDESTKLTQTLMSASRTKTPIIFNGINIYIDKIIIDEK